MATKGRFYNGQLEYIESTTWEHVIVAAPVLFYDDFIGQAIDTTIKWTALDVSAAGDSTPLLVADAANGVVALPLDGGQNEVELSGLTQGDQRNFAIANSLVAEFRFRFSVLPTGAVVACIGLAGDHNAAVNTVAESIWFRFDGNGVCTVENDDTANETSKVATGVTLIANQWMVGRIDLTNPAAAMFFINGNRVASTTTFNMNNAPTLCLQPVMRIGKEGAAATVGTLQIDAVRIWQKRS